MKKKYSTADFAIFKLKKAYSVGMHTPGNRAMLIEFLNASKQEIDTFCKGGPKAWEKKYKFSLGCKATLSLNGKMVFETKILPLSDPKGF